MSKKIDRAIYGPSLTEVLFAAVLGALLGALIGAALLILKPVVVVRELPKEADRVATAVYYVEGSRDGLKARQAIAKRKAFLEGQSVAVTEDEINSLVPVIKAPAAPKPEEKKATGGPAPAPNDVLLTGTPNFRIQNGVMQVGVPVTVGLLGLEQKVIVQARGGFAKEGNTFVFEPTQLYLGSCAVDRVPFLAGYARKKFVAAQAIPADVATAWSKLASVTIDGNVLKLTMQ